MIMGNQHFQTQVYVIHTIRTTRVQTPISPAAAQHSTPVISSVHLCYRRRDLIRYFQSACSLLRADDVTHALRSPP